MAGRDTRRDREFDDWFAEPEPSLPRLGPGPDHAGEDEPTLKADRPHRPAVEDDWIVSSEIASGRASRFGAGRRLSYARTRCRTTPQSPTACRFDEVGPGFREAPGPPPLCRSS